VGDVVDADVLTAALSTLAGADCVCLAARSEPVGEQLFPQEREYLARAVPTRQAEFGTARVLARRALATLGMPPQALVPEADRSPHWPPGVVGSISHSDGLCAVVVGLAHSFAGIGLDLETTSTLDADMQSTVCTTAELQWLDSQNPVERRRLDALVFSAKESFYKCQYVLTRTFLEFKDVELQFDLPRRTFRAAGFSAGVPQRERLQRIEGRWVRLPQVLLTLAMLR
jgi:4'-phosphopantetheinyl transferase EntD